MHFLRFFPQYRMRHVPPTPPETLARAAQIARAEGLHHVYAGNVLTPDAGKTLCPGCGGTVIERAGHRTVQNRLVNGACPDCRKKVYGIWD